MTFSEKLNNYIEQLGCSSRDLSNASGLSSTVISRYRNGDRTPAIKSTQFEQLIDGLYKLSCDKKIKIERKELYSIFSHLLNDIDINFDDLSKNVNAIISTLNINIAELSRFIGYDSSFVSKIRAGSRNPAKPKEFVESICNFIVAKYKLENNRKTVSLLIGCPLDNIQDDSDYFLELKKWLSTNTYSDNNYISNFLNHLDNFDLNEYIRAIHFDELKIPFVPFYKSSSRNYYGIEEMKHGELDFFKATVLSKSDEPIFMCSDMPMEDMAKDVEFGKKWMFAIAMTLKKGLHLNIIHNLDRPFNEMMLGLESWIPIYMTGQVSPFYLKGCSNTVYKHLNYVSGPVALVGECINGYHDSGKYYLTSNKTEVSYYKKKSELLLNKASSLMDIYNIESKNKFIAFLSTSASKIGNRRRVLSSLPLHTISDDLLLRILKRNNIQENEIQKIMDSANMEKKIIQEILTSNTFADEFYELSKEEFNNSPASLSISNDFLEEKIEYSYEEYIEHINLSYDFANKNHNYNFIKNTSPTFKNIQVLIVENNWIMISKIKSPSIHFVVYHPKLRNAIENFIPPVVD